MGVSNFDPRPDPKDGGVTHLDAICPASMSDPKGTSKCLHDKCGGYRYKCSMSVDNPTRTPGGGTRTIKKFGYCGLAGEPW